MAADKPEYAIVGGGIAGLSLAIALLKRDVNITIYEQAPKFGEIGAGVAFSPNAVRAMQLCDESVHEGFKRCATHNQWASKSTHYFDWLDGFNHFDGQNEGASSTVQGEKWLFTLHNKLGANSVHRANFLDELVKLIPQSICKFGKHLETVRDAANGRVELVFHDGTTAQADAVLGCDGIKSQLRKVIYGTDNPASVPHYSHKYVYRGLIPREKAVAALGEDRAVNAFMHLGKAGHLLTFPVRSGAVMNVVAFKHNPAPWPDSKRLTLPSTRAQALADFAGWSPSVQRIIELLDDNLDCWGLFDTQPYPLPSYAAGRLVLVGDAAHATTPHHGAGAGMCIEDAAVLAHLLADPRVATSGKKGIEAAFRAFDLARRERTQWLVASSRITGDLFEWMATLPDGREVGDDTETIYAELLARHKTIWDFDLDGSLVESRAILGRELAA